MCATQLNDKVNTGELSQFSIIKVSEFLVNTMPSGQKIIILLKCDQVQNPGSRLGNPSDVTKAGNTASAPSGGGGAKPMYGNVGSASGSNPYGGGGGGGGNMYGGGNSNPYGGASSNPVVRTAARLNLSLPSLV